jgi:DNA polymerase-3 subunit delta
VPAVTPETLRQQIASRRVAALYLLHGPDDVQKSELAAAFADVVEVELRAFNVERLYGGDVEPADVVDAARTLPMMTDRRVIVVLQAEKVLQPKREGDSAAEQLAVLESYLESPIDSTVLVFVTGEELNRQRRVAKLLARNATAVECGGIGSRSEAAHLVEERARERGMTVHPAAIARLLALAGGDSAKLRADSERVLMYVGEGVVTADAVDAVIMASEASDDDWALPRALERKDVKAALRELRVRLDAGDSVFAILGQIAFVVRQPPPRGRYPAARVPGAIDALFRTDLALKSSGGDPRVLVERLIVELCG